MRVFEVMTTKTTGCSPDTDLREAATTLQRSECAALPVIGKGVKVLGLISDRDICMALAKDNARPTDVKVRAAMTGEYLICHPEDEVQTAMRQMEENGVERLLVVDDENHLKGVLSLHDLAVEASSLQGIESAEVSSGEVSRAMTSVRRKN